MATDTVSKPTNSQEPDGVVARLVLQLRQFVCGMHGHDTLMHFEHGRISLLCASCGYETPGWDVKGAAVRRDEGKGRVVSMPLVHKHRAA
jgi:hypothetical protein